MGTRHSAILVERGAGQSKAARANAQSLSPSALPGPRAEIHHALRRFEPGSPEGGQGKAATGTVSLRSRRLVHPHVANSQVGNSQRRVRQVFADAPSPSMDRCVAADFTHPTFSYKWIYK